MKGATVPKDQIKSNIGNNDDQNWYEVKLQENGEWCFHGQWVIPHFELNCISAMTDIMKIQKNVSCHFSLLNHFCRSEARFSPIAHLENSEISIPTIFTIALLNVDPNVKDIRTYYPVFGRNSLSCFLEVATTWFQILDPRNGWLHKNNSIRIRFECKRLLEPEIPKIDLHKITFNGMPTPQNYVFSPKPHTFSSTNSQNDQDPNTNTELLKSHGFSMKDFEGQWAAFQEVGIYEDFYFYDSSYFAAWLILTFHSPSLQKCLVNNPYGENKMIIFSELLERNLVRLSNYYPHLNSSKDKYEYCELFRAISETRSVFRCTVLLANLCWCHGNFTIADTVFVLPDSFELCSPEKRYEFTVRKDTNFIEQNKVEYDRLVSFNESSKFKNGCIPMEIDLSDQSGRRGDIFQLVGTIHRVREAKVHAGYCSNVFIRGKGWFKFLGLKITKTTPAQAMNKAVLLVYNRRSVMEFEGEGLMDKPLVTYKMRASQHVCQKIMTFDENDMKKSTRQGLLRFSIEPCHCLGKQIRLSKPIQTNIRATCPIFESPLGRSIQSEICANLKIDPKTTKVHFCSPATTDWRFYNYGVNSLFKNHFTIPSHCFYIQPNVSGSDFEKSDISSNSSALSAVQFGHNQVNYMNYTNDMSSSNVNFFIFVKFFDPRLDLPIQYIGIYEGEDTSGLEQSIIAALQLSFIDSNEKNFQLAEVLNYYRDFLFGTYEVPELWPYDRTVPSSDLVVEIKPQFRDRVKIGIWEQLENEKPQRPFFAPPNAFELSPYARPIIEIETAVQYYEMRFSRIFLQVRIPNKSDPQNTLVYDFTAIPSLEQWKIKSRLDHLFGKGDWQLEHHCPNIEDQTQPKLLTSEPNVLLNDFLDRSLVYSFFPRNPCITVVKLSESDE